MENKPLSDTLKVGNSSLSNQFAPAIELKGSVFTLTVLRLQSLDLEAIQRDLTERVSLGPRFFENAPVVLDLEPIKGCAAELNLPGLFQLLRQLHLIPVGLRRGTPEQQAIAVEAGIAVMKGGTLQDLPSIPNSTQQSGAREKQFLTPSKNTCEKPSNAMSASSMKTKIIHQPVRSGQQVYAPEGDLILLAPVSAGAEVIAGGNIHVYAPLRGRALAGVNGEIKARIFCQSMEAELVAVAGHYQIFEDQIPKELYRKPVQVYLNGDQLTITPLLSSPQPK